MSIENKGFGYIPDLPDVRDHYFRVRAPVVLEQLPVSVDLTPQLPPVYDQGSLGSCVSFATGSLLEFLQMKNKQKNFTHCHLFIYYNARVAINTVNEDSGCVIRDAFKSCNKDGSCPETLWPYDVSKFKQKPPQAAYTEALNHQLIEYMRLQDNTLDHMKDCLAQGYPFVFGFSVYDSFMSSSVRKTGVASLPKPGERQLGGHAVLAVGYDDAKKVFICRNSWGTDWGNKGNFTMPYDYLTNDDLTSDFWTARKMEGVVKDNPQPTPTPDPTPDPKPPMPAPDEGYVKPGGWGANKDPKTWRVAKMRFPFGKWKVTDNKKKNVATDFSSKEKAQYYIDYWKSKL